MKNIILFFGLILIFLQTGCGPAAEDRDTMHKRAKVFQDSIAKTIKDAISEVEVLPNPAVAKDTTQKNTK